MNLYYSHKEPITAMATINPRLCQNCSIRVEVVQGGEGPNPHVHVYSSNGKVSMVSLTEASYASHHDNYPPLTRKEKAEFIKIMKSVWRKQWIEIDVLDEYGEPTGETQIINATGYEAAVQIWCDTYGGEEKFEYDAEGKPIMPDYSRL